MPVQANNALILDENGLTRLIGTNDYMQFTAGLSLSPVGDNGASTGAFTALTASTSLAITGSASITGDLTVEGVINSSGTTDSITKDAVIDLLHGNANVAAAKAGGLSANLWPSDATNCGGAAGLAVKEFTKAGAPGGPNAQVELQGAVAQAAASIAGNFIVTGIASIGDTFTVGTCAEDVVFVAQAGGGGGGAKTFNTGGDVNAQGTNLSAAIAAYAGLDSTDAGAGSPNFTLGAVSTVNMGSGQNGRTATAQQVAGGSAFAVTVPGAGAYAGGTGLSEGMFIEIADAVSTENDGLFQIVGIAGALIDVAGGATAVSTNAPWVQTGFIAEADTAAKVRAINLAGLAFSNGALTDQSGGAITIGSVCDSYTGTQSGGATSVPAMVRDVYWTVSGSDSLQKAYQVGSEIALLDADGNLRISTDDTGARADFVVSNQATTQNYLATTLAGLQLGSGANLLIDLNGNISSSITFDGAGAKTITQAGKNLSLTTTGGGAAQGDVTVDASQDLYLTGGTLTTVTASGGDLTLDATAGSAVITAVDTSSFTMAAAVAAGKSLDFSATNSNGAGTAGITIDADDTVSSTTDVHTFISKDSSSWTLNGIAKTLTIESKDSLAGGGAQKLLLTSDGNGADSIQMASTGGGFDLQSIDDSTISCAAPVGSSSSNALVISATNASANTAALTLSADDVASLTSDVVTITAGLNSTWSMAAAIAADHKLSILATNSDAAGAASIEIKAEGDTASGILIENDGKNVGVGAAGILINAKNTGGVTTALAKVASQGDIELDADYNMLLDAAVSLTLDCTSSVPAITTNAFTNQSGSQIQDGMCVTITGNAQVSAADAQTAAGKVPLAVSPASWANGATATVGTFLGSVSGVRIMEAHSRGWLEVANNGTLTAGDTITISGAAALVAGGGGGQWAIGGDAAATAGNIVAVINAQAGNKVFASIFGAKILLQSTERAVANTLAVAVTNAGCLTLSAATLVKVAVDPLTHTGVAPVAGSIVYLASSTDPSRVAGGGFSTLSAPSGTGDSVIRIGTVVKAAGGGVGTKASPSKSSLLWNTQFIANRP